MTTNTSQYTARARYIAGITVLDRILQFPDDVFRGLALAAGCSFYKLCEWVYQAPDGLTAIAMCMLAIIPAVICFAMMLVLGSVAELVRFVRSIPYRALLGYERRHIPDDPFHPSLDINGDLVWWMDKERYEAHLKDLDRRREVIRKRDPENQINFSG